MDGKKRELEVLKGFVNLIQLEVAVPQLITNVDIEDRVLEDYEALHFLLDRLVLIDGIM
jgi:hypothetical protein